MHDNGKAFLVRKLWDMTPRWARWVLLVLALAALGTFLAYQVVLNVEGIIEAEPAPVEVMEDVEGIMLEQKLAPGAMESGDTVTISKTVTITREGVTHNER